MCVSPTGNCGSGSRDKTAVRDRTNDPAFPAFFAFPAARAIPASHMILFDTPIAAMHQGNYATFANYLEKELRYMDAGERGSKAPKAEPRGTPGYR